MAAKKPDERRSSNHSDEKLMIDSRSATNKSARELLVKVLARAIHHEITDEKKLKKSNFYKGTRLSADEEPNV